MLKNSNYSHMYETFSFTNIFQEYHYVCSLYLVLALKNILFNKCSFSAESYKMKWSKKQIDLACSESNPTFVGKIIFYYAQNRA